MICLALTAPNFDENAKALDHYRGWIRLAELRVDRLAPEQVAGSADFMNRMHREHDISFILTIRTIEDGGVWPFGEDERRSVMLRILEQSETGVIAYVDLEMNRTWPEVEEAATKLGARFIRSCHNFAGTPGDLESTLPNQYRKAGDVVKAAVMVRGMADLVSLMALSRRLRANGRPFILIGMGPYGLATRILAARLGCLLTFASSSLQGHVAAAPGHMDPQLLAETFGYYAISEATRIFGIIGNPVLHSRSPGFHNGVFHDNALDAVYLPFQVDDLPAFFQLAEQLPIDGFSVTIPHKEGVMGYLSGCEVAVKQIGACNTVLRHDDGWFGANTDAPGFFLPLAAKLGPGDKRQAVVIGAGGAARSVVQALLANGFRILVLNRSLERARILLEDFESEYPGTVTVASLPDLPGGEGTGGADAALLADIAAKASLVVQTSSVGMEGHGEAQDPFWFYPWTGSELAYDIIYTPAKTAFLARAEAAGCRILNGWPMFEQQAKLQAEHFRKLMDVR